MFKIADNPTFTVTVPVFVPTDGGHRKETFKATFAVVPTDEVARFDLADEKSTREFLARAIVSLGDIAGEDDQPIPYSDELRDRVLSLPYARLALARAYFDSVTKVRAGN